MTERKPTRADLARTPSFPARPPQFNPTGAPCKRAPQLFFQADRERDPEVTAGRIAAAKAICADCPLRGPCLREAITNDEKHGIWGGYTARERQSLLHSTAMRRVWAKKKTQSPQPECGTTSGYEAGCRCDECRAASTAYQRDRRARKEAAS